ncbi:MAG TPA: Imm50 family immunity protein [Caulobacteraceae bacterium]|jgi:hypothetical protein|nr:Imm50 family immunity protein [Caulobacteraceae bacterium]
MNVDLLNLVPGGPELLAWFGYAPRFHDAEVLGVILDREGATCAIKVHGFEMTNDVDARGCFVLTKHVVVTFVLGELTEIELDGFNFQNAVMGISIERGSDAQFRMEIDPAYGLGGVVEGRSLEIAIAPGTPPGSQYAKQAD